MSHPILPQWFQWDGDALVPRSKVAANESFVVGEYYRMAEVEERSEVSHRHEFAFLREAWKNLPEHLATLYPSPEHLRKRALIQTGWYDEQIVDAGNNAVAIRIASIARGYDEFALISVSENLVIIRTAKSQARGRMNKQDWQKSKTDILELVSQMIGVEPDQLERAA